MSKTAFHVQADWDPEVGVWIATSEDVPGLATEADTIDSLADKLQVMIPELLEANEVFRSRTPGTISFELSSHRQESIRLAS